MNPQEVQDWIREQGCGEIVDSRTVTGGSIHNSVRLTTESTQTYFLKTNRNVPHDLFPKEAKGLLALSKASGAPRVPKVHLVEADFLLLEDLRPNGMAADYWEIFGRQMANLHKKTRKTFGFMHDNYLGTTVQENPQTADGFKFFAEYRICALARLVREKGLLASNEVKQVEALAMRLNELVPEQPASLLHGDLWSGNAMHDHRGQPAIFDPAVYYGWAEADLAMTTLFGGFQESFYAAYIEERPLEPGWRERFPIYNLYHLLNHLYLFGAGYHGQVMQVVAKFSG